MAHRVRQKKWEMREELHRTLCELSKCIKKPECDITRDNLNMHIMRHWEIIDAGSVSGHLKMLLYENRIRAHFRPRQKTTKKHLADIFIIDCRKFRDAEDKEVKTEDEQ